MGTGTTTALELNIRASPNGDIIARLPQGTELEIVSDQGDWLEVTVGGMQGFVGSRHVERADQVGAPLVISPFAAFAADGEAAGSASARPARTAPPPSTAADTPPAKPSPDVPPEAGEQDIRIEGGFAFGPGGVRFAKQFKLGLFNAGQTSIGAFLKSNREAFASTDKSLLNIMGAVSANEGKLEAINTWDNCFLSFGAYQWTVGQAGGAGELASVLDALRSDAPEAYATYFGQYGLQPGTVKRSKGLLPTGFLELNGQVLATPEAKENLRQPVWAYRFWRAGHDRVVRRCEVEQCAKRIDVFYRIPRAELGGHAISDFITSEFGIALILDQHVNRPGHVVATVRDAVAHVVSGGTSPDPANWTDNEEQQVIDAYLALRQGTNMTDSQKRAESIRQAVVARALSEERNSFA
jgi:hypothetical protein